MSTFLQFFYSFYKAVACWSRQTVRHSFVWLSSNANDFFLYQKGTSSIGILSSNHVLVLVFTLLQVKIKFWNVVFRDASTSLLTCHSVLSLLRYFFYVTQIIAALNYVFRSVAKQHDVEVTFLVSNGILYRILHEFVDLCAPMWHHHLFTSINFIA